MKRVILGVAAVLVAAFALAACGGGGKTSGVAGAHHTKAAGSFRASVHGFEARLKTSVRAFQSGNLARAASGSSLLANCSSVTGKLASQATTHAQMQAVVHMRIACSDMSKATHAGMSGNLTKAKAFARAALKQAQIADRLSGRPN